MMSKRKWFVLLGILIIYLFLGAGIFFNIESQEEERNLEEQRKERFEIADMLETFRNKSITKQQEQRFYKKLTDYCGKPVSTSKKDIPETRKWDFYHSIFFVITVVTTVGYGNIAPTTMFTRIFMIFYALIGVPMNGIVMVTLGHYFGKSFTKLYDRWKKSKANKAKYDTAKLGLIGQIILYLIPGFTFFIFLPAGIMVLFEGWDYDLAVYYCFVTLTTIGFGDYVASFQTYTNWTPLTMWVYKIFLLVWIIIGLGYVVMILGFITQAMRSKRMRQLEHVITANIKKTPVRIRQELRNLLQEFLFLKVKPVYKGEFDYTPNYLDRSQSCPDLTIYSDKQWRSNAARQRALSECARTFILHRIQSDSDLQMIDKELTFQQASQQIMHQKDLLMKVVDALSNYDEDEFGAYHGFSDSEILASEHLPSQHLSLPVPERRRCMSDIRAPSFFHPEAAKANIPISLRKLSEPAAGTEKTSHNLLTRIKARFASNKEDKPQDIEANFRRASMFSNSESRYLKATAAGRPSVLSLEQEAVLEQTSIADFLRAVSAITESETLKSPPPRRKLGRAGFSEASGSQENGGMRRTSLMPQTTVVPANEKRRFSLRPVEENLTRPQETVPERRRFSLRPTEPTLLAPPPYSENEPSRVARRFSRVSNLPTIAISPVQRQVNKRENQKDDSSSS